MDDIARAAGITKPMLYRYFGSKEGLYAAYLQMTGHELVDKVRAPDTRDEAPQVRLRAGLQAFLTYVKEHRAGWTVLHGESTSPTDAQIAREVAELRRRIIRMLTTLFGDEAFAHAFTGAAESLATWWVNQPQPSNRRRDRDPHAYRRSGNELRSRIPNLSFSTGPARYLRPAPPSARPRTTRNNVASSSAGARSGWDHVAMSDARGDNRDDHGDAEQTGGRHDGPASRQQDSPNHLEHSGEDLQRGRPGKAEAAKRVQLPMVKDELHQASDDERDPGDKRHPRRHALPTDPLIRH